jgi:hypothetical protein
MVKVFVPFSQFIPDLFEVSKLRPAHFGELKLWSLLLVYGGHQVYLFEIVDDAIGLFFC